MPVPFSLPPLGNVRAAARFVCSRLAPRHGCAMRYRPCRPMPAPTRRGPASPMRGFLAKPRIPLRSRCALRSMPPYGSASLRAPLTAASRWRSRFRMSEALTTWLRARGMQDLHLYGRSRFATSPAQIILPCRGARRLPRDSSRGFGCAVFAYALRRKEGPCGFDHARPSVCRYRGSSCGRGASCGAGRP